MLHTAIDVLGAIAGLLGLVALWLDPREEAKKRKFLVVALGVTLFVEGGFLGYDRYQEKQKELADQRVLENKETQLVDLLCLRDMNYEEIYKSGSMGWSNETLDAAIDDLMQNRLLIDMDLKSLKSPDGRALQVRFFHLKDRSKCAATVTH